MATGADGAEIRQWRAAAGLTLGEAARLARVNRQTLAGIEAGRRVPPPGMADHLRRVYASVARGEPRPR